MALAGVAVGVVLFRLAQFAGADAELMALLYWPIGVAAIASCYLAGKYLHQLIARFV